MFECKVLTVRDLDFKDEKQKPIKGMQLWVIAPSDEPSWNGLEVCKIWIADGHPMETVVASLKHGDSIAITFDRRGKPVQIDAR